MIRGRPRRNSATDQHRTAGRWAEPLPLPALLTAIASVAVLMAVGVGPGLRAAVAPRTAILSLALLVALLVLHQVGAGVIAAAARGAVGPIDLESVWMRVVVGLVSVATYVLLRSALAELMPLPRISAFELWVFCAAWIGWGLLSRTASRPLLPRSEDAASIGVLVALVYVTVAREAPRRVMLSSDPDFHALHARTIMDAGTVWVSPVQFDYPSGLASSAWILSALSSLDVRNVIAVLPVLAVGFASQLIVRERGRSALTEAAVRILVLVLFLRVFALPYLANIWHQEGTPRQAAVVLLAGLLMAIAGLLRNDTPQVRTLPLTVATGMLLGALSWFNPAPFVLGGLLLLGALVATIVGGHGARAVRAPIAAAGIAIPLLLLDPYWLRFLTGGGNWGSAVIVESAFRDAPLPSYLTSPTGETVRGMWSALGFTRWGPASALVGPGWARMALLIMGAAVVLLLLRERVSDTRHRTRLVAALVAVTVSGALLLVVLQFAANGASDTRTYLLLPYLHFALFQLALLTVTALGLAAMHGLRGRLGLPAGIAAGAAVVAAWLVLVGPAPSANLSPRVGNACGSIGCASDTDVMVLRDLAVLPTYSREERVLVPNVLVDYGREYWAFPLGGGRVAPHVGGLSTAFYYFETADFTPTNYATRVCEQFDLAWLRERDVRYVFVPSDRNALCFPVAELASRLPTVLTRGESLVLRIP